MRRELNERKNKEAIQRAATSLNGNPSERIAGMKSRSA